MTAQPSRKAMSQRATRAGGNRLTVDDWIDGGLDLLASEGVTAIRIPRLCQELGVTKGSFYWHFDDIGQLMEAMAGRWSSVQAEVVRAVGEIDSLPIGDRLERMAMLLIDEQRLAVELTVREWARDDEQVDAAIQALDRRVFEVVRNALLGTGFDESEARVRAGALVYAGIGFIHGRRSLPTPTTAELRAVFDVLTRRG
jgi:AcrR family transcriptional regulator